MFTTSVAAVCFIACHGGPADHFATFAENMPAHLFAAGPALAKFNERGVDVHAPFTLEGLTTAEEERLAAAIAQACAGAEAIVTDVGHPFDIKLQCALAKYAPDVPRYAYYDNPEPYVPGGYSTIAAQVMLAAPAVLFSNASLAHTTLFAEPGHAICLAGKEQIGVGYYPLNHAETIALRRATEKAAMRKKLFDDANIVDSGQQLAVYFGGNNEEYFSKAFPAFLAILAEGSWENMLVAVQQHPGAKASDRDRQIAAAWMEEHPGRRIHFSSVSSNDAQTAADIALYYQTSMAPQFVLAGIPTIQVGHEPYGDILVRNGLCRTATSAAQLKEALGNLSQAPGIDHRLILNGLGINNDWLEILRGALLPMEVDSITLGEDIAL